jgi:parkin
MGFCSHTASISPSPAPPSAAWITTSEPPRPSDLSCDSMQLPVLHRAATVAQAPTSAGFFVHCPSDACSSNRLRNCMFRMHCSACGDHQLFTPFSRPVDWNDVFHEPPQGVCHKCGADPSTAIVIPHCTDCKATAYPLTNVQRNIDKRTCISCWEDNESVVVNFKCSDTDPHVLCIPCFKSFAKSRISERKLVFGAGAYSVNCPYGCKAIVEPFNFRMLGPELWTKYRRFAALCYADDVKLCWCPFTDCQTGFMLQPRVQDGSATAAAVAAAATTDTGTKKDVITCIACKRTWCTLCRQAVHTGQTCVEAATGGTTTTITSHSKSQEEAKTLAFIAESTKKCPSCDVPIFKDQGCNHMTCVMCSFEFCWIHLKKWEQGGECQRNHWYDSTTMTRAANFANETRDSFCLVM